MRCAFLASRQARCVRKRFKTYFLFFFFFFTDISIYFTRLLAWPIGLLAWPIGYQWENSYCLKFNSIKIYKDVKYKNRFLWKTFSLWVNSIKIFESKSIKKMLLANFQPIAGRKREWVSEHLLLEKQEKTVNVTFFCFN